MQSKPNCPDSFTAQFGIELVKYLGGDPAPIQNNWCWSEFAKQYSELIPLAEKYFAAATTGDPGYAAYCMVMYCGGSREWAEGVITAATTGDPINAAHLMVMILGSDDIWFMDLWLKKLIKKIK